MSLSTQSLSVSSANTSFSQSSPLSLKRKVTGTTDTTHSSMTDTLAMLRKKFLQTPPIPSSSPSTRKSKKDSTTNSKISSKKTKKQILPVPSFSPLSSEAPDPLSESARSESDRVESVSPIPGVPCIYHYSSFYEDAQGRSLSRVLKQSKNKKAHTIVQDSLDEEVVLIQQNYKKISELQKRMPISKPEPIKAGPDSIIEIETDGVVVKSKDKSRKFDIHRSVTPTGEKRSSIFPKSGSGFVTIAGHELQKHVDTFRKTPKAKKFYDHILASMEVRSDSRSDSSSSDRDPVEVVRTDSNTSSEEELGRFSTDLTSPSSLNRSVSLSSVSSESDLQRESSPPLLLGGKSSSVKSDSDSSASKILDKPATIATENFV